MKERRKKTHYVEGFEDVYGLCGIAAEDPRRTMIGASITCRVCQFHYLASRAPWARKLLDDLRGRVTVSPPRGAAEQMNGQPEGSRGSLGRPFREERGSEKAISELLTVPPTGSGVVEPVMNHRGTPALTVWIEKGKVAEYTRNTGQVGDETLWDTQLPIDFVKPD